jgi:hypothetical protein
MAVSTSILDDAGATLALIKTYLGGDEHANEEPIHDDARDIDATDFNRIAAGLAEVAKRLRPGNIVGIPFELTGLAASATAQAILGGASDKTVQRLFKDGTLVGITAELDTAITSGTLTVQPQIATANTALSLVLNDAAQQKRAYQLVADAGAADVCDAGDLDAIEVDITTASLDPDGGDVHGMLWFSVGEEESL